MLSFEKLNDLVSATLHVYVMYQNTSEWLTANYLIVLLTETLVVVQCYREMNLAAL